MSIHRKLTTVCCAAVLAFGLAACGGGSDDDTAMMCPEGQVGTYPDCSDPPVPLTAYEAASEAIAAAETVAEADAAYEDADKDAISAAEAAQLRNQLAMKKGELMTAADRAMQQSNLMAAAGAIDTSDLTTQEAIDAAEERIAALQRAIDAAEDVDDTSMYESQVSSANGAVETAQNVLDQTGALMSASMALQGALDAFSDTPTQAEIDAAQGALDALEGAISGATEQAVDTAEYSTQATRAEGLIEGAQNARTVADNNAADDKKKADDDAREAMAATAAKLHAGIGAPTATDTNTADTPTATGTRFAGYVTVAGTPTGASVGDIVVGISDNEDVALSEDEDTMVAALNGWTGKRYARTTMSATMGTYEAIVYSHVGEPTPGPKFNSGTGEGNVGFTLDGTSGETASGTTLEAGRVAIPSVTRTAGTETFELPDNSVRVIVAGSYWGVSGTYYCTPTGGGTDCSAAVAEMGLTLGGGTWSFKPTNPEARVMSAPDGDYASYGWWLHTATNGDLTASAFVARRGTAEPASGITALMGTATYVGGAAGKYALSSTTGGTNDAGHFTARATLEANFNDDTISGTIDNFMGAGGAKDWSVELRESTIGDTGPISSDGTAAAAGNETVWTIGGDAAGAAGSWSGSLQENGDDGVPAIATGTFYTEYGTAGEDGRRVRRQQAVETIRDGVRLVMTA